MICKHFDISDDADDDGYCPSQPRARPLQSDLGQWAQEVILAEALPDAAPCDGPSGHRDGSLRPALLPRPPEAACAKSAAKWKEQEDQLLDMAVDLFKAHCISEVKQHKRGTTISFEMITREIQDLPTRILSDPSYIVDSWPDGV